MSGADRHETTGKTGSFRTADYYTRKRSRRIKSLKNNIEAWLYLSPAVLVLMVFWLFPVIVSIIISFTNWKGLDTWATIKWIGFGNYRNVLGDEEFRQTLLNTFNYALYSVPLTIALSLAAALFLNSRIRGRSFFRTVYFLPFVTTWVAISILWNYFYHRDFGLANYFLKSLGLSPLKWLAEPRGVIAMFFGQFGIRVSNPILAGPSLAMFSIIITTIWRSIGYYMIIFLAGLQNIDRTYYEAAEIDGASPWHRFWSITFPLLSPMTFFILIISMINSFKVFVPMLIMTPNGGPDNTCATIVFHLYEKGFQGLWLMGHASAIAYVLFVIILVITVLQNRVFGRRVHYS
ncbi:MAG TPA: sugar ABC transporter permease [Candidatus Sumerlaeota bacterium]|nr:sugar ABC transporter permease [Candidatus Sumerlaeota bacterium]